MRLDQQASIPEDELTQPQAFGIQPDVHGPGSSRGRRHKDSPSVWRRVGRRSWSWGESSADWRSVTVETADRVLTAEVIAALRYWPHTIWVGQKNPPDPVAMAVLPPFFNEVLQDLPWWNREWRVDRVQPGLPNETGDHRCDPAVRFTEVSIPGTVASGNGESLPLVAKVGFTGDRLIRFQAHIGDMVIGPAVAPAGQPEPHPFARMLTGLMDLRGISVRDMARATGLSMSTVRMLRRGRNPDLPHARLIAETLNMPEADIRIIAGLDNGIT
ncbi:helix-turn-helix domain-containing protein [Streptomyces sp. NPDC048590]|uniref:helix-turn-helix domain-containing protein n=1 Tax=Streptomyces sp. NPDC048590 TaxID=3365574 RepID=UPI003712362E